MTGTVNPFAMIATPTYWLTRTVNAEGYDLKTTQLRPCTESGCTGTLTIQHSRSESRSGGAMGYTVSCDRCDFRDCDGDGWSNDEDGEGAYEAFCDAEYHRANPDAYWTDALCHNCEEVPAQEGAMLCGDCEVKIYGAEQAAAKVESRRLRALPYRPISAEAGA